MATLFAERALPTDPDFDSFSSGNAEVDAYFRERRWFRADAKSSLSAYRFRLEEVGEIVGYATAAFGNKEHPDDSSHTKKKYLVVHVAGVASRFHGLKNPRAPLETLAISMFNALELLARGKESCVGLYLWVRSDNARAIGFYKRFGFVEDPAGPKQRDAGAAHITMRKHWA